MYSSRLPIRAQYVPTFPCQASMSQSSSAGGNSKGWLVLHSCIDLPRSAIRRNNRFERSVSSGPMPLANSTRLPSSMSLKTRLCSKGSESRLAALPPTPKLMTTMRLASASLRRRASARAKLQSPSAKPSCGQRRSGAPKTCSVHRAANSPIDSLPCPPNDRLGKKT